MRNPIVHDIIRSLLIGVIAFEVLVIALVVFSHFSPSRLVPIAALSLVSACVAFSRGAVWLTRRQGATHVTVSHPASLPPRWSTPAAESANRHSSRYGLFRIGGMPYEGRTSTRPAAEGPYRT